MYAREYGSMITHTCLFVHVLAFHLDRMDGIN